MRMGQRMNLPYILGKFPAQNGGFIILWGFQSKGVAQSHLFIDGRCSWETVQLLGYQNLSQPMADFWYSHYQGILGWNWSEKWWSMDNHHAINMGKLTSFLWTFSIALLVFYPLVNTHSYGKWPFTVDFPIEHGDFL